MRARMLIAAAAVALVHVSATAGLLWWSTVPVVAGWQPTVVLTGSMAPALQPGDVALIGPAEAAAGTLPPERIVLVADPSRDTGTYLHRLARWEDDGTLVTRGDANRSDDAPVTADRVLGQVRLVVPVIGLPAVWLRDGAVLPLALLLVATWSALAVVLRARALGRATRGVVRDATHSAARRHAAPRRAQPRHARAVAMTSAVAVAGALLLAPTGLVETTVAPWSGTASAVASITSAASSASNLTWWGSGALGQAGAGDVSPQWSLTTAVASTVTGTGWRTSSASVATGGSHTCAIRDDGTLWCWGANADGQLGNGTTTPSAAPVKVSGSTTWKAVAAGTAHTCGITSTDWVMCWGRNGNNQLGSSGITTLTVPTRADTGSGLTTATRLSLGDAHSCAISTDQLLYCWGSNSGRQSAGNNSNSTTTPTRVEYTLTGWFDVAAGGSHTCAIRDSASGALYCWGLATSGQTLHATTTNTPTAKGTGWSDLTAGADHTCGRKSDGTLWCWGASGSGQLGSGTAPVAVGSMRQVGTGTAWTSLVEGSGNANATCARQGTTTVTTWCWGSNVHGELGAALGDAVVSTPVQAASGWQASAQGTNHLCAVDSGGALVCAGWNLDGQLGRGTTWTDRTPTPQTIAGGTWSTVSVGQTSTCGIRPDKSLWCWGLNSSGQLGVADTSARTSPTRVGSANTWTAVAVGARHACAVQEDRSLWCWGDGSTGQTGTQSSPTVPTRVGTGLYQAVTAGDRHTCALDDARRLQCWGDNASGQLGFGDRNGRSGPSTYGGTLASVTWSSISAGRAHTCGVVGATVTSTPYLKDTLWCWGANASGQLGIGTFTDATAPAQVGSETWGTVAVGGDHTCAMRSSTVRCWGENGDGQLGTGQTTDINAPQGTHTGYDLATLGPRHTCARLISNGSTYCWGDNGEGQLGLGTTSDALVPTLVPSSTGTTALEAGGLTTLRLGPTTTPGSGTSDAYLNAVLADTPLSYWRLDDAAGATTAVARLGPNGTYTTGTTLAQPGARPGHTGTSALFNGTSQHVAFTSIHTFPGRAAMSVEAWVKPDATWTSYPRIVSKERYNRTETSPTPTIGADHSGWALVGHPDSGPYGHRVTLERYAGATNTSVMTTAPLPSGVWSHLVATYDGTTMRIYVNGTLSARAPSSVSLLDGTNAFSIGSATGWSDFFDGGIDEVAVYGTALSPERVLAHYNAGRG